MLSFSEFIDVPPDEWEALTGHQLTGLEDDIGPAGNGKVQH